MLPRKLSEQRNDNVQSVFINFDIIRNFLSESLKSFYNCGGDDALRWHHDAIAMEEIHATLLSATYG